MGRWLRLSSMQEVTAASTGVISGQWREGRKYERMSGIELARLEDRLDVSVEGEEGVKHEVQLCSLGDWERRYWCH